MWVRTRRFLDWPGVRGLGQGGFLGWPGVGGLGQGGSLAGQV
jgi:hypothetical protein